MSTINGPAVGVIVGGVMFTWAGIRGESIPGMIQDILQGRKPQTGTANQITVPSDGGSSTGGGGGPAGSGPVGNPTQEQAYAFSLFSRYGWGADQQQPLVNLWNKESGWNPSAKNPSSGAYGIPQSLPASKMASAGADWQTNPQTQIRWGLSYIAATYRNPAGAWAHEQANNWY